MKKIKMILLLGLFSCSVDASNDSISVGYIIARSGWTITSNTPGIDEESSSSTLHGPAIALHFHNFIFGFTSVRGTYLFRSVNKDLFDDGPQPAADFKSEVEAVTREQDLYIGYQVHSDFSVFLGHKLFEDEAIRYNLRSTTGVTTYPDIINPIVRYSGMFYGVGYNRPISQKATFTGKLSVIRLSRDEYPSDRTADGVGLDLGLILGLSRLPFFTSITMHAAKYKHKFEGGSEDHRFPGMRVQVYYRFEV